MTIDNSRYSTSLQHPLTGYRHYTVGGIDNQRGYAIQVHPDAVSDLAAIQANRPRIAARLVTFLEEYLEDDPEQRLNLAVKDFQNEVMHVGRWSQMWRTGLRVSRIKLQGNIPALRGSPGQRPFLHHRIPFAFDDRNAVIWILGIFERKSDDDDYDPDTPFGRRIQAAYRGLGLPTYQ